MNTTQWYMLTLVGKDRVGIVARIAGLLYQGGCILGEASMLRLGGNFTIMLMVRAAHSVNELQDLLAPAMAELDLHLHLDQITGELHHHQVPDVQITVHGADRAGIVAEVSAALAEAGCNIVNLDTDVGGSEAQPFYIMRIEGIATRGMDTLQHTLDTLAGKHRADLDIHMSPIDTVIM